VKGDASLIEILESVVVATVGILILVLALGVSWLVVCSIVKLIALCFGLTCSWAKATGIWLILLLLQSVFHRTDR
jgi:hypothetical protein